MHVTFEVECIDRMFLNVYVPQLHYPNELVGYVHRQLGLPIASTAPMAKITERFAAALHRLADDFARGERKDDVDNLDRYPTYEMAVHLHRT